MDPQECGQSLISSGESYCTLSIFTRNTLATLDAWTSIIGAHLKHHTHHKVVLDTTFQAERGAHCVVDEIGSKIMSCGPMIVECFEEVVILSNKKQVKIKAEWQRKLNPEASTNI